TLKNKILNLNLLYKFVGSRWINDENEADPVLLITKYPAYSTFNIRVWHTFFKHLTAAVNMDNIFDVIYVDDRLQQSPGRMINAEITVKF
ncbi:MAG: TonB-dependent receptor, partial [Bacteroidales bacterium]|nr:TonB-dependent receptor [Bacteroidales bacterium]